MIHNGAKRNEKTWLSLNDLEKAESRLADNTARTDAAHESYNQRDGQDQRSGSPRV